ncbi:MAG TPA: hypothetical protein VEQ09_11870 [Aquabacterium sp.]|nr:hypothetical protein [Aquabacterium sp.]
MRKVVILFSVLLVLAGVARAADAVLDMDLMQTVEDTNKSLSSNIALQDAAASTKDARELHELFKTVEAHYVSKPDAADGVQLSRKSLTLTQQIIQQVGAKDFTGASESSSALSRTCRACHTFYKQS